MDLYAGLPVVAIAEASARDVAAADRQRYLPFLVAAEHVAAEHGIIAGGQTATLLLLRASAEKKTEAGSNKSGGSKPPTFADAGLPLDAFTLEYVSGDAWRDGRRIADAVHAVAPSTLAHYTRLDSRGSEAVVTVDGRALVRIQHLRAHKGASLAGAVIPTKVPALLNRGAQVLCLGPEIQLIGTYRALCDPARAADWAGLLADEARLRARFLRDIRPKVHRVGGGPAPPGRAAFWRAIYEDYVRGRDRVLVGRAALDPRQVPHGGVRVQLVTARPLEEEAEELRGLAQRHGLAFASSVQDPRVPTDPALRRLTAYFVGDDGKREAFLDAFDAGQAELVPWVAVPGTALERPGGAARPALRVGTPFVVLRFRLVDIWTLQLLAHIGAATAAFVRGALFDAIRDFERAAAAPALAKSDFASLFPFLRDEGDGKAAPVRGFIGGWVDPTVRLRRLDRAAHPQKERPRPPYFPGASKAAKAAGGDPESVWSETELNEYFSEG